MDTAPVNVEDLRRISPNYADMARMIFGDPSNVVRARDISGSLNGTPAGRFVVRQLPDRKTQRTVGAVLPDSHPVVSAWDPNDFNFFKALNVGDRQVASVRAGGRDWTLSPAMNPFLPGYHLMLTSNDPIPQVLTSAALAATAEFMQQFGGTVDAMFQSSGAGASVPHQHIHFSAAQDFPIAHAGRTALAGHAHQQRAPSLVVSEVNDWPAPTFVFSQAEPAVVGRAINSFVARLQLLDLPHTLTWTKDGAYVSVRGRNELPADLVLKDQKLGCSEAMGVVNLLGTDPYIRAQATEANVEAWLSQGLGLEPARLEVVRDCARQAVRDVETALGPANDTPAGGTVAL